MEAIDWSKAPEGATHATAATEDYHAAFWRYDGLKAVELWVIHPGGDIRHVKDPIPTYSERERMVGKPASTSAWTGTGLPPVGTVCEVLHNHEWVKCEVVAHKDMGSVINAIVWIDADRTDQSQGIRLRPIKTQEQIEAEEREKALSHFAAVLYRDVGMERRDAELLWNKGYRKQDAPK